MASGQKSALGALFAATRSSPTQSTDYSAAALRRKPSASASWADFLSDLCVKSSNRRARREQPQRALRNTLGSLQRSSMPVEEDLSGDQQQAVRCYGNREAGIEG